MILLAVVRDAVPIGSLLPSLPMIRDIGGLEPFFEWIVDRARGS